MNPQSQLLLALLLPSLFAAGCQPQNAAREAGSAGGLPPIRVTTIRPERKTLTRTIELPGRVEAFEVAPLHAKVTGYVERIPVDLGDRIRGPHGDEPGMVLCELQVPELREEFGQKIAQVAQTKAEVLQAEAAVKVAEAAIRSVMARVREAQAAIAREEARFNRWQSEFQRVSQLSESGALTKKVADETRAELESADAGRKEVAAKIASVEALEEEAQAGLEKARADVVACQSTLAVAEADARRVQTLIDYALIRAPFDGVVVERHVHTGHLVRATGGGSEAPLLTVMRMDPVRVYVDVPEADAVHVNPGTNAKLRIPSLPGEPLATTITRTSWSLNRTSRTLTAEIDVPNPDGRLRPGLYLQVELIVAELENALSLPKTAIVTQDKQTYCFVVGTDGKVIRTAIGLGVQAGTDFEIRTGLTGDEQIIGLNAGAFRDGQLVEVAAAPQ
jgi:HlyD family secretion protein